jgi:hypothetical protein
MKECEISIYVFTPKATRVKLFKLERSALKTDIGLYKSLLRIYLQKKNIEKLIGQLPESKNPS